MMHTTLHTNYTIPIWWWIQSFPTLNVLLLPIPSRWYTMVHADGSVLQTWSYLWDHGLQGFLRIWPKPTAIAWKIIASYGAFEAALQLLLPGTRVEGPISPTGNRPIYKVLHTQTTPNVT